jgi:hypothetical protein
MPTNTSLPTRPPKKAGPGWTITILALTALITLVVLMLSSHH